MYRYEYDDWAGFGNRVKVSRKQIGLTVEKLADSVDRTENYINRLEKGEKSCSVHTVHQLCRALKVSADFLLYGKEYKEKDYSEIEIINNVLQRCDKNELKIIKDVIVAIYPQFINFDKETKNAKK